MKQQKHGFAVSGHNGQDREGNMENETGNYYVVHHEYYSSRTRNTFGFKTEKEALAKYNELHKVYRRDRVWITEAANGQVIHDTYPRKR